jgi:hypothetical protein
MAEYAVLCEIVCLALPENTGVETISAVHQPLKGIYKIACVVERPAHVSLLCGRLLIDNQPD